MKKLIGIEQIRGAVAPVVVELTGWNPDETVEVKLRKPGLVALQMKGGVPNPVLAAIEGMYAGVVPNTQNNPDATKTLAQALHHVARAALVEPTMAELEEAEIELTTQQYNEIYAFVLGGTEGIIRFREQVRPGTREHGEAVPDATIGTDGSDGSGGNVDGGRGDHVPHDADVQGTKPAASKRERGTEVG